MGHLVSLIRKITFPSLVGGQNLIFIWEVVRGAEPAQRRGEGRYLKYEVETYPNRQETWRQIGLFRRTRQTAGIRQERLDGFSTD